MDGLVNEIDPTLKVKMTGAQPIWSGLSIYEKL